MMNEDTNMDDRPDISTPTWWSGFSYRTRRAFKSAWCRVKGGHYFSKSEWGTGMDGTVDLYCGSCGGFIENRPMDDLPREVADLISDVLGGNWGE